MQSLGVGSRDIRGKILIMVVQIRNKKHQEFVRNVLANENDTKVKIFCGNNVGVSLKRFGYFFCN